MYIWYQYVKLYQMTKFQTGSGNFTLATELKSLATMYFLVLT